MLNVVGTNVPDSQDIDINSYSFNNKQDVDSLHRSYKNEVIIPEAIVKDLIDGNPFMNKLQDIIDKKLITYIDNLRSLFVKKGINKTDTVFTKFAKSEEKILLAHYSDLMAKLNDDIDADDDVPDLELSVSEPTADGSPLTDADESHFEINPQALNPMMLEEEDDSIKKVEKMAKIKQKIVNTPILKTKFPKVPDIEILNSVAYISVTLLNFSGSSGFSVLCFDDSGNLLFSRVSALTYISIPKQSGFLFANLFASDVLRLSEMYDNQNDINFILQRYTGNINFQFIFKHDEVEDLFNYVFRQLCEMNDDDYLPYTMEQFTSRIITSLLVVNSISPFDIPIDVDVPFITNMTEKNKKRAFSLQSLYNSYEPIDNNTYNELYKQITYNSVPLNRFSSDELTVIKDSDYPVGPGLIAVMGVGGSGKSVLTAAHFLARNQKLLDTSVISIGEPGVIFNTMNVSNLTCILNSAINFQDKVIVVDSLRLMMLTGQLGVGKGGISKEITNLLTYIDTICIQNGISFIIVTNPMEDSNDVVNNLFHAMKSVASATIMTKEITKHGVDALKIDVKISTRLGSYTDFKYDRQPQDMSIIVNSNSLKTDLDEKIIEEERYYL